MGLNSTTVNGLVGPHIIFTGANIHVRSGGGGTNATLNGRSNLIVGYNESTGGTRTGSHNLVVGPGHTYTSYGSLVAGNGNTASGQFSSVTGGYLNTASGFGSSVSGGYQRSATQTYDWRAGTLYEDW